MVTFWLEFALVLGAILIGIRRGGVALGLIGGLGVTGLAFIFNTPPGEPPITVMLIILAVVTASATLQVAGGLDYMVQKTEKVLRAHPNRITILAPLSTFLLTVCVGTGHAVYSLLPVIADVALKTRIRPERPMAISSVAAQMGITASPVAAAVTTFLAFAAKTAHPVGLTDIIMVTFPSGIIGVLAAALWSTGRGKDLDKDPEFLERCKDPAFRTALDASVTTLDKVLPKTAKMSVALFFGGILTVIILSIFPVLLPHFNGKPLALTDGRPGGFYMPRFRNLKDKSKNFIRGYGFEGESGATLFPEHAASTPGFGKAFKKTVRDYAGAFISMGGFGEVLPRYDNYVELDPQEKDAWGVPVLKFHITFGDNERKMVADMNASAKEMFEDAGIEIIGSDKEMLTPGWSIHELGTSRMGANPKTSVVNQFQQSHDVKNLFVVDGSSHVSASCQNPTWTIMALAWRSCDYLADSMRKGEI